MVWNIPLTRDVEAIDYGNIFMFKVKKPKFLSNIFHDHSFMPKVFNFGLLKNNFHNQKLWLSRIFLKYPSFLTLNIENISKTFSFFGL